MKTILFTIASFAIVMASCSQAQNPNGSMSNQEKITNPVALDSNNWNKLTAAEEKVIVHKGTEYPGTGEYVHNKKEGLYICKRCNAPLFESESKFNSGTGWPSFDDCVEGAVGTVLDADGYREEIVCNSCKGHLGHVFYNEGFTGKNTRHCVNSVSLNFISEEELEKEESTEE